MSEREPLIRNISDTARWVAHYRALESERSDALFHDPLAARLAGERGAAIARAMPRRKQQQWAMAARTVLFDRFVTAAVADGVDTVIVLAAGFDARPYRLKLPASLRWIEVDLPPLIREKEQLLARERPVCLLKRRACDLGDEAARRAVLAEIGAEARRAVVLTEGLLVYLSPEHVAALARDLAAVPACERWITDLIGPKIARMLKRRYGRRLDEAGAPFRFAPEEGPAFFEPQGWRTVEAADLLQEAARLKRLGLMLKLIAKFARRPKGADRGFWSGVLRLERVARPAQDGP